MRFFRLPRTVVGWTHVLSGCLAWAAILWMVAHVVWPIFGNAATLGIHDWDTMESYRYLVVKTILRYHQFPFWNPYSCGGHTVWGWVEGDSTVVSPFFVPYLVLAFPLALRVEVVGSALLSAIGCYLFAGRFTRSPAVRAFIVVVYAANGRWALQVASGHAWHLTYAWVPWVLYFVDRAFAAWLEGRSPVRDMVGAAICVALITYGGGIYPLPQVLFVAGLYSIAYASILRDFRPLLVVLGVGALSVGFSAPKLFPMLSVMSKYPRFTDSPEWMDVGLLITILTSRDQDFGSRPAAVPYWGWHEWGMYIGVVATCALFVGLLTARGERAGALRWTGLVLLALAFGSIHPYAPWPLLHKFPVFRSQHVPSRWLYPALLVISAVLALALERAMERARRHRPWLELAALATVAYVAHDIAGVARLPMVHAFDREPPRAVESLGPFHTEEHIPPALNYSSTEWSPPSLPAEMANIGTIDCGTFAGLNNWSRGRTHTPGLGAKGVGGRDYRGEAFVVEGHGTATITRWTPNEMVVQVAGASPGDHVALNQNYDAGWRANGRAAIEWSEIVAAPLSAADQTVVFRYRPAWLWPGLAVFALTVGGLGALRWGPGRLPAALSRWRRVAIRAWSGSSSA